MKCTDLPQRPPRPTFSENPSRDGHFQVRVPHGDSYSWVEWNTGPDSPGNASDSWARLDRDIDATGEYRYRARECIYDSSEAICSDWSYYATAYVLGRPGRPGLAPVAPVSACDTEVELNWSAGDNYPSPSHTRYYRLDQMIDDGPWNPLHTGLKASSDSHNLPGHLDKDTVYRYRVRSRYYWRGAYSEWSNWDHIWAVPVPRCKPGTVSGVSVSLVNPNHSYPDAKVQVTWNPAPSNVGRVDGYQIRRQASGTGTWTSPSCSIQQSGSKYRCTYTVENHDRGDRFRYKIWAHNSVFGGGDSVTSGYFDTEYQKSKPPRMVSDFLDPAGGAPTSYTIKWNAPADAGASATGTIKYTVKVYKDEIVPDNLLEGETQNNLSNPQATFNNRNTDTDYLYQIDACNADVCSNALTIGPINIPDPPGNFTIEPGGNNGRDYTIRWHAPGGAVVGYELARSTDGGQNWVSPSDPAWPNHVVVNATSAQATDDSAGSVKYRVRACNEILCGAYSAESSYSVPPEKPVLNALAEGDYDPKAPHLAFSWQAVDGADHYRVKKQINGGNWSGDVYGAECNGTACNSPAVAHGQRYRYRVFACNAGNACSLPASTATYAMAPGRPGDLTLSQPDPAASTDVKVEWMPAPGQPETYQIWRRLAGGSFSLRDTVSAEAGQMRFPDPDLSAGQTYEYRLRAQKAGIFGAYTLEPLTIEHPAPSIGLTTTVGSSSPDLTAQGPGGDEQDLAQHWAGYHGVYDVDWALSTGVLKAGTGIVAKEQTPTESWQPVSAGDGDCVIENQSGHCAYDQPRNDSDVPRIYHYRAQACSPNAHCTTAQLSVGVLAYPKPGVPPVFRVLAPPGPDGAHTLEWSAPANTPPNASGAQSEPVTRYKVREGQDGQGAVLARVAHIDSDGAYDLVNDHYTLTNPYRYSAAEQASGAFKHYTLEACFESADGAYGCSTPKPLSVYLPHAAPTGLSHANFNPTARSYDLEWTAPAGGPVTHYQLQERLQSDPPDPWSALATVSAGGAAAAPTEYIGHITDRRAGRSYEYRVRACTGAAAPEPDPDRCSAYSQPHKVDVEHPAPGAPENLAVISRDNEAGTLTLTWTPPSGVVALYQVKRLEGENVPDDPASVPDNIDWADAALVLPPPPGEPNEPEYPATGLANGQPYGFVVRACAQAEPAANCGAAVLNRASLDYRPPGIPGPLSHDPGAVNPDNGQFTVDWTAPASINTASAPVTGYRVEYRIQYGPSWLPVSTPPFPVPAPGDPAEARLTVGTRGVTYEVHVSACNTADTICGAPNAAYPVDLPFPPPAAPTWEHAPPGDGATAFTLDWSEPEPGTYIDHYRLESYHSDTAGMPAGEADWSEGSQIQASQRTFNNPVYGRTYRYRVRACSEDDPLEDTGSCGPWSEIASLRLKFPKPDAPSGLTVTDLDKAAGDFTLQWNRLDGPAPQYTYGLNEDSGGGWDENAFADVAGADQYPVSRERGRYAYRVRACNPAPDNDCGSWSSPVQVNLFERLDIQYRYDALGRLTRVSEDGVSRSGYCYDNAGNRDTVTAGGAGGDTCAQAQPLGVPANLSAHIVYGDANGDVYEVSWEAVAGATGYRLRYHGEVDGEAQYELQADQTTHTAPQGDGAPKWVQACDAIRCSGKVYFSDH